MSPLLPTRPLARARQVVLLLGALVASAPTAATAWAADPVRVVLPATGGPDEGAVDGMLVAANLLRVDTVDARAMVESVRIVRGLEGLPDDCPESVSLATFRSRLAAARRRYDTLDVAGALSDLTGLELELACLAEPPPSAVIFEVELALAQAESVLASVSMEADEETSAFYAREADRALDRAVAAGAGLPMPRGLDRETARALAAARERREEGRAPRFAAVGKGTDELRLNGRALGIDGDWGVEGQNLVQLAGGSTVLGAEWLTARRGEGIVLDLADEPPIESASGLIERLARRPADARESEVLAAIAAVASPDLPLVYVGFDKGVACVFIVSDGGLERIDGRARARRAPATRPRREVEDRPVAAPAPGERPAAGAFRAAVGVGFGGGWRSGRFDGTTDSDGELLAGLYARVGLGPLWSIAAEVAPTALTSTLNPSASGVEGGVPLLVGVRNGERSRGFSPEFGGDIGVRFSGGSADPSLGLVARACAGGAGASGKRSGVRVGGCAAYSDGSLSLGIFLGVESRLDE